MTANDNAIEMEPHKDPVEIGKYLMSILNGTSLEKSFKNYEVVDGKELKI
jgi:hypothetical protein